MPDGDDEITPFSTHLDELRKRLIWSLVGLFMAFTVVFSFFADPIVRYVQDIAIVSHDVAQQEYPSFQTAVEMPYRARGSTWTLRNSPSGASTGPVTFTRYEVLEVSAQSAEVLRTTLDERGHELEERRFTHTFGVAAGAPETEEISSETVELPAVEFERVNDDVPGGDGETPAYETITLPARTVECFRHDLRTDAGVTRTWVAKTGGVVVRIEREVGGPATKSELVEHRLNSFDERVRFTVIATLETFSTTMRVSLYAALVFAYPWVMLQIYLFIAPGLYRHERQFFRFAIPSVFVLFMAGAAFGRYVLLPISIPFLLGFNVEEFGVETNYSLAQFLGLVFAMTFGLGFVFQIPLLVAPLIRFGLLSPEFFRKKRRYTVLVALVIGAVISPTGSPIDMVLAGLPVFLLVESGVWFGKLWKRSALKRAEKEAREAAERGEKIDPEALAGGLAVDLEKKLGQFSKGGARKFARELVGGLRESGKDIETIFDDNYKDTDKPPVEVKLKKRPPKPEPAASAAGQPASPKADTVSPELTTTAASSPAANAKQGPRNPEQEFPDRPWDENVTEPLARYIEDRISQRLEQYFERELRPWMDRIEHELKNRNGDHK